MEQQKIVEKANDMYDLMLEIELFEIEELEDRVEFRDWGSGPTDPGPGDDILFQV